MTIVNCFNYGTFGPGWGPCGPRPWGPPPMPTWNWGYNPRVSDGIAIGQSIISGLNGVVAGLDAKYNKGANDCQAAQVAFGTAAVGTSNALLGNIIDKNTGTYTGSILNSTMSTFTNPFFANVGLSTTAMMTTPFMNPFCCPPCGMGFGFYC